VAFAPLGRGEFGLVHVTNRGGKVKTSNEGLKGPAGCLWGEDRFGLAVRGS
jgi:hypothetical protein